MSPNSSYRERKILLASISYTKWSIFVSNGFIWWGKFGINAFFTYKVWKNISQLWNIFDYELILGFEMIFWVFEAIYRFIKVSKVFSRSFRKNKISWNKFLNKKTFSLDV
jgi:hypothetical protein